MRKMQVDEFATDWQYEKAQREQRKKNRKDRERRKNGRGLWEAKPADNSDDE